MSGNNAIDPLPLQDFPQESDTQDPGFEQLFSDLVAYAGTPADGFDDDVAIANSLLDTIDASLTGLSGLDGGTLDDAFVDILAVDPTDAGQHVVDLAAAIPDIQANVDNLGNRLAGASPIGAPAPTPAVTITNATGPFLSCPARQGMGPASCASYPCSAVVPFTNTFSVAMHVKSITLVQRAGGPFTATTDIPATLQPGERHNFQITIQGPIAPTEQAQLQIAADTPGAPYVFCVDGGVGSSGYGGGGGGGGPIVNPIA